MSNKNTDQNDDALVDNLVINVKVKVYHNQGKAQVESDLPFHLLEKVRYQLMEAGYDCQIVNELKKNFIVVT